MAIILDNFRLRGARFFLPKFKSSFKKILRLYKWGEKRQENRVEKAGKNRAEKVGKNRAENRRVRRNVYVPYENQNERQKKNTIFLKKKPNDCI